MTPSELEAIEKRAEAATKGPWTLGNENNANAEVETGPVAIAFTRYGALPPDYDNMLIEREQMLANAHFVMAAREDVPALVLEVKRLRGVLVEIRTIIETEADDAAACQLAVDVVDRELPEEAP